jgi:hypothetical protein
VEFSGGYLSRWEMQMLGQHGEAAIKDERLPAEQRAFLAELTRDIEGYPMYRGKYAGIGGVYRLRKA